MQNQTSALIVARPGQLRASLTVLLTAIPQMGTVNQADDGLSALTVDAPQDPDLVLLDWQAATLEQLQAQWPRARCIVLADDKDERKAAESVGADAVLLKGVLAARLFTTIQELLCDTSVMGRFPARLRKTK
jgi:DNA-binding NarL/FixJ family response regulator